MKGYRLNLYGKKSEVSYVYFIDESEDLFEQLLNFSNSMKNRDYFITMSDDQEIFEKLI